ncbi:P-II family nitrogen regulator, partial [Sandarakinorhabdus sp.]|uniref:P-II family nitrogen regulator n=1 Tax=Sandarakinorhabdus sp. TaxID=1916663 RepID=UPI00333E6BB5
LKLSANLQIDVVVEDADTARLVDSILLASSSANADSGKIFVSSIGHAVRIRTGELDDAAL